MPINRVCLFEKKKSQFSIRTISISYKCLFVGLRGPEGSVRDSHRTGSSTLVKESLERFWVRPPVSAFDICGFFLILSSLLRPRFFPNITRGPVVRDLGEG